MTVEEIKQAVDSGKTVHWQNPGYIVIKSRKDYLIKFKGNGHCIGLTWADGKTLNGKPHDFYIEE